MAQMVHASIPADQPAGPEAWFAFLIELFVPDQAAHFAQIMSAQQWAERRLAGTPQTLASA